MTLCKQTTKNGAIWFYRISSNGKKTRVSKDKIENEDDIPWCQEVSVDLNKGEKKIKGVKLPKSPPSVRRSPSPKRKSPSPKRSPEKSSEKSPKRRSPKVKSVLKKEKTERDTTGKNKTDSKRVIIKTPPDYKINYNVLDKEIIQNIASNLDTKTMMNLSQTNTRNRRILKQMKPKIIVNIDDETEALPNVDLENAKVVIENEDEENESRIVKMLLNKNITNLNIKYSTLSSENIIKILKTNPIKTLSGNINTDDKVIPYLYKIQHLNLINCEKITTRGYKKLFNNNKNIISLNVVIYDDSVLNTIVENQDNLENLALYDFSDINSFRKLIENNNIKNITLANLDKLSDEDIKFLSDNSDLNIVQFYNIKGLTEECLNYLHDITAINLYKTNILSEEGMKILLENNKDLKYVVSCNPEEFYYFISKDYEEDTEIEGENLYEITKYKFERYLDIDNYPNINFR